MELSHKYCVITVTIYYWIKQYSPVKVADNKDIAAKDYLSMQKRMAELEMENYILKKLPPYSQKMINEIVSFI